MLENSTVHIVPYNYPQTFEVKTTETSEDMDIQLPRALGFYNRTEKICMGAPIFEHVDGGLFLRKILWQSDKYLAKWVIMGKEECYETSALVLQDGNNIHLPSSECQWTYRQSVSYNKWSDPITLKITAVNKDHEALGSQSFPSSSHIIIIASAAGGAALMIGTTLLLIWKFGWCKQKSQEASRQSVAEVDQNPEYGSEYYYEETEIQDNNTYYQT